MVISIITINKNNAGGLAKTMHSVLEQDWPLLEYIVIDGGSTDDSVNLIKSVSTRLQYWVSEPDRGVYDAQNKGLAKAGGEFVLFLNSGDTFCEKNSITSLAAKAHNNAIIYGDLQVDDGNGSFWIKTYPDKLPGNYFDYETLPHPATLIPAQLLRVAGGYDVTLNITADWKFFRETYLLKKADFVHVPKVISFFDISGLSSKKDNQELITSEKERVKARSIRPKYGTGKSISALKKLWKF